MGIAIRLAVLLLLFGVRYAWRPAPARGLAVQIPQTPTPCIDGASGHRLHVLANGAVQIDGVTAQLPATLKQLYANRAERVLFLTAEPATTMQTVATVIDIAAAQIDVIAIVPPSLAHATCWTVHQPARSRASTQ